jgi:ribonuclease HIII
MKYWINKTYNNAYKNRRGKNNIKACSTYQVYYNLKDKSSEPSAFHILNIKNKK